MRRRRKGKEGRRDGGMGGVVWHWCKDRKDDEKEMESLWSLFDKASAVQYKRLLHVKKACLAATREREKT